MSPPSQFPTWFKENQVKLKPIYIALSGSTIIMGIASQFISSSTESEPANAGAESIQMLLSVLGMACCFAAMIFNQWSLKPQRVNEHPLSTSQSGHVFMSFLLTWALAQSCATFGLVISVLTHDSSQYTMFGVLSLLTILAHPYTEGRVRRATSPLRR